MDVDLNRTEADLQAEESALHAELTKLATVAEEVAQRLETVRRKAEAAGDNAMVQRSYSPTPQLDENLLIGARTARAAAIRARQETNARAKKEILDAKKKLQALAQQTMADEKELVARERAAAVTQSAPLPPARASQPVMANASAPAAAPVAVRDRGPITEGPKTVPIGKIATVSAAEAAKKRQSPRVKMQAAVDLSTDSNFFNGFSANISDGGLFVATVNLLPLGTEVDLAFTLPSGVKVEAKGVVRWVREVNDTHQDAFPGLGVQFSALQPQAQAAINDFLAQRDPLFFAAE
ncbi:MAG: TIGR02266 family protein [Archangium sp.]|nr:TIGR02266 family protein [Archangium sp.]